MFHADLVMFHAAWSACYMKQMMKQGLLQSWLDRMGGPEAFAALADLWPDAAVFAVDADRNVVLWSKGAERLLGFAAGDLLGQHCLKGSRCAACMQSCGLAEDRLVQGAPLEMYRADGGRVSVRKYARAFTDAQGRFQGGVELLVPVAAPAPVAEAVPAPPGAVDERASEVEIFHGIVTRDPGMKQLFATVRNVSRSDVTVLVRGESGAGRSWPSTARP
jgi:transcriptional regulator with PAS, ATPase and Fis domain